MADDKTKLTKAEIEQNPQRYRIWKGGAVFDNETHRICAHMASFEGSGYSFPITKENGAQMQRLRKEKGLRSHLRGLILGAKLELPPDDAPDDVLVARASDAYQLYVAHMGKTFLKSENLRGQAETFSKLVEPFTNKEAQAEDVPYPVLRGLLGEMAGLARQIREAEQLASGDIIDVTADEE